jgi:hypothetical protein
MIQTSSMLGLMRRTVPTACGNCGGIGYSVDLPTCKICQARGLVGNESEICRSCNGTGHIDSFAMIPAELLHSGTHFRRRCDKCGDDDFEITSEIKSEKLYKTWESSEELREYELVEKVTVACSGCHNSYAITIDPAYHKVLDNDTTLELERLGIDLSFLYQAGSGRSAAAPEQQPA